MEKELILKTLESCNDNRTKAADILQISVRTLRNKLKEYGASSASK
jgi:DNA-binding NtrC family response regulator